LPLLPISATLSVKNSIIVELFLFLLISLCCEQIHNHVTKVHWQLNLANIKPKMFQLFCQDKYKPH
jgi:hypothetical protein